MEFGPVGMMKFPDVWKVIKAMFQTTNQMEYQSWTVLEIRF